MIRIVGLVVIALLAAVGPAAAQDDVVALLPRDLSPWSMFLNATWLVQAVMVGLIAASVLTWTVWLAKTLELAATRRALLRDLAVVERAQGLTAAGAALAAGDSVTRRLLAAADEEWVQSADALADRDGLKERIASRLERIEAAFARRLNRGTGTLATVGATAPFIGLFGTVWGIMNAFIGIAQTHATNLAVVAPGIAEALLATACGLVAAIPAVMFYNMSARRISACKALTGDIAAAVLRLASRDLSRGERHDVTLRPAAE